MIKIRPSRDTDVAAITAIYAHHVLTGTGTFEMTPYLLRRTWFRVGRMYSPRACPTWWWKTVMAFGICVLQLVQAAPSLSFFGGRLHLPGPQSPGQRFGTVATARAYGTGRTGRGTQTHCGDRARNLPIKAPSAYTPLAALAMSVFWAPAAGNLNAGSNVVLMERAIGAGATTPPLPTP